MVPGVGGPWQITSGRQGAHHSLSFRAAASPGASGTWESARQPCLLPGAPHRSVSRYCPILQMRKQAPWLVTSSGRPGQWLVEPGFHSPPLCAPHGLCLRLCSGPAQPSASQQPGLPCSFPTEGGEGGFGGGWSWGTSGGNPSFTHTQLGSRGPSAPGWEGGKGWVWVYLPER